MNEQLKQYLAEYFTVRVKDGKELQEPETPRFFDPQEAMCPELEDRCYTYHYATKVVKLPTIEEFIEFLKCPDVIKPAITLKELIFYYHDFGKTPLTLGDFVPCVDGVPVDEPKQYLGALEFGQGEDYEKAIQYQSAKDQVIFEGWELEESNGIFKDLYYLINNGVHLLNYSDGIFSAPNHNGKFIKTISDIIKYGVYLKC